MATEDARKLFVAGLAESVSEEVLRQLFEATGSKVVDVSLPRDRATGRVRGFGFVTLASPDEASRARQALDGSIQSGRSISVRPFSSEPPRRGERPEPRGEAGAVAGGASEDRTLYVGNLPYDTTQQELMQLFADSGVGPIARIHLPPAPAGGRGGSGVSPRARAYRATPPSGALRNADVRGRRLMVNIAHPRGSGGPSERPGRSRPEGGWGSDSRFTTEPPLTFEGGRPPPERRARTEGDWSDDAGKKKKKRAKGGGRERPEDARRRGGGSNWQVWDDDDE